MAVPQGSPATRIILVVDDEPEMLDSVQSFLERAVPGVRVITAASSREGIAALASQPVDLVLSDYRMPGQNGLEFLVEAYRQAPDTPRIMMTAFPDAELAFESLRQAHVHRFIVKPMKPELLQQYVVELLGASHSS